ncbi:YjbH domain-containing protein [Escherichia coli]|nr:YjbH domain-containing protein [Escherichia coli]EFI5980925.1 YjbH domain-containing protein [Escherichia coli]
MKKRHLLSLLALGISTACYGETYPAPIGPSQSDFGGVGLLQTPTARMAREGELSLNYRDNDQYRYYSASVQLFPWLETTLRYTDVRTRQYSSVEAFSGDQTYKDKAFDLKLRLWEESYWLPQVAVGARDIGGTGLFDAEYLVASKAWGPFDFTLGLGWGYLGTSGNVKNPLCSASDKYCYRDNSYKQAGSIDGSQMFHGPASLFGVTLRTNFNDLRPSYNDNARPQYQPQPQDAILQHSVVANQLTLLKYNAGLADPQIQTKGDTLYVTGEQVKYRDSREGIIRANRIVMNDLPDGIKTIRITENRLNMPQVTTETDVASLKNHLAGEPLGHETKLAQKRVEPVVPQSTEQGWYIDKSRFDFHIDPVLNQSVGGPENFYMYQLGVMGTADLWLTDHLLTTGSLFANLANNYDKFNYTNPPQDSHLPRVRTHVREYVQNDVYVNNLQANYFQHLGNGFYGQVYGGYLETMFGGAGAEVLYRPLDSNWAFGLDANYVKQRDWRSAKDMMKFTDYSVKTGHLTAYWTPSFAQDVLVKASVGQYLAGDKGGTLEIAKRFDSGVVVGGYATITNVSKEEYGEGDFTKGVYVSVPLDLFSSGPTRSRAAIGWTPLTRDGGQQLGRKFQLYDMTSDRSVNFR